MIMVGSGTTTVACGVTFVLNLLLFFFLQGICAHSTLMRSLSSAMWMGVVLRLLGRMFLLVSDVVVVVRFDNLVVVVVDSS